MNKVLKNTLKTAIVATTMAVFCIACTEKPADPDDNKPNGDENIEIESLTISPDKADMFIGDTLELALNATPENASTEDVQLFANNPKVVELKGNKVIALAEGNAVITAAASNGVQAICNIAVTEKPKQEEPDDKPVVPDSTSFNVEFRGSYSNEFEITIVANVPTVRYFVWCEEASVLESIGLDNKEGIIAHDMAILEQIRLKVSEEEGRDIEMKYVINSYTYQGTQQRRISPIVEGFLEIKPATKYYVYVYGLELDGTVTTDVFTFDQTTSIEMGSDDEYDIILAFEKGFYNASEDGEYRIKLSTSGIEEFNFYVTPSSTESLTGIYSIEAGTFNADYSSFYYQDERAPVDVPFNDVTVQMTQDGNVFDIMATGTLMNEKKVKLSYYGTLEFRQ